MLELLASQAAISLKMPASMPDCGGKTPNASELRGPATRQAYLAEAQIEPHRQLRLERRHRRVIWSDETFGIFGYDKAPSVAVR